MTIEEAEYFMASVTANGTESPLIQVDDERKMRSDRFPPRHDGSPRGIAAAAWLRDEFGWPREHLVFESPEVVDDGGKRLLHQDALDITPAGRAFQTWRLYTVVERDGRAVLGVELTHLQTIHFSLA